MCPSHPHIEATIYCLTDRKAICYNCDHTDHKGHNTCLVTDEAARCRDRLGDKLNSLQEKVSATIALKSDIEGAYHQLMGMTIFELRCVEAVDPKKKKKKQPDPTPPLDSTWIGTKTDHPCPDTSASTLPVPYVQRVEADIRAYFERQQALLYARQRELIQAAGSMCQQCAAAFLDQFDVVNQFIQHGNAILFHHREKIEHYPDVWILENEDAMVAVITEYLTKAGQCVSLTGLAADPSIEFLCISTPTEDNPPAGSQVEDLYRRVGYIKSTPFISIPQCQLLIGEGPVDSLEGPLEFITGVSRTLTVQTRDTSGNIVTGHDDTVRCYFEKQDKKGTLTSLRRSLSISRKTTSSARSISTVRCNGDGKHDCDLAVQACGDYLLHIEIDRKHFQTIDVVVLCSNRPVEATSIQSGQNWSPHGSCIDMNILYVCDCVNHTVCIFELDETLRCVRRERTIGNGQFSIPTAVCVCRDHFYVCDNGNDRILQFRKADCNLVRDFGSNVVPGRPRGICTHKEFVYVTGSTGICVFDKLGTCRRSILNPSFAELEALYIHADVIYVSDRLSNAVFVLDMKGSILRTIGKAQRPSGQIKCPEGLYIHNDLLYVSNSHYSNIVVYDLEGKYVRTIGHEGTKLGEFKNPAGLCVQGDVLYVSDKVNHRVQAVSFLKWCSRHPTPLG